MFGLGKTKLNTEVFVNDQWIKVTSPERKSIWRAFVEQSKDTALEDANFEKLCNVMISVYLQFLKSTVIQTQGAFSDSASDFYIFVFKKEQELDSSCEEYSKKFNQTWGTATEQLSGDKMMDMVNTFEVCMGINLQQATKEQLSMEFSTLISSMEDVLSKIKLV